MQQLESYMLSDFKPDTVVAVIASFDGQGQVKPLYVRLAGLSLKVKSCWLKPSFRGHLEFHCMVIDGDCLKPLILSYNQMASVWTVPRRADM